MSPEEKTFLAEEIYQTIDQEARKQNVNNVPVIFMSTPEEGIKGSDNSNNNSESGSGSSSGRNESSKNNSIPGFGLLGSLACLCGGWRLKKR